MKKLFSLFHSFLSWFGALLNFAITKSKKGTSLTIDFDKDGKTDVEILFKNNDRVVIGDKTDDNEGSQKGEE